MAKSQRSRQISNEVQRQMHESRDDMIEIGEFSPYASNESIVTTIGHSARQVLDIDAETDTRQYIDPEFNALVIVPVEDDPLAED